MRIEKKNGRRVKGGAGRRRYNYTSKQRGERKIRNISTPGTAEKGGTRKNN